jgi:ubiquinone/menaquinone biosynthesis C-methylase UbiE
MSLTNEYKRQFGWRAWSTILDALPLAQGETVLDLGCGVGDLAAEFVNRGSRVIGIDVHEEFLLEARSRRLSNAEFRTGDLRSLTDLGIQADGIWCSFTAAYFPDLPTVLPPWTSNLKPGGWIALTEIDDLFGHEPLSVQTKELFKAYAENALAAGRYDFFMGRKLRGHLEAFGFKVSKVLTVEDQEFSFSGPARPEVLDAWRARFNRMQLLRDFCGENSNRVQEEFLSCLLHADHESISKVCCCIARKQ